MIMAAPVAQVTALVLPADDSRPARVITVPDTDDVTPWCDAIRARYADVIRSWRFPDAQLVVDDEGAITNRTLNVRGSIVAGRPVVGDVLVFGLGDGGETLDVPQVIIDGFDPGSVPA